MSSRSALALVVLFIALTPLLSPWERDLMAGDETKYSQVLREMRASRNLVLPTLNGQPYTHKPPLHFWMLYALSIPFGVFSIWPYVIPSLIAYWALILLLRKFGDELFPGSGWIAAFILATFYLIWGLAQTARMDLTFTFLITLGMQRLWRFLREHRSRDLLLCAAWLGMAILVKGPMAFVMPLVVLILERIRGGPLPRGRYVTALVIVAAIPLLWLIPALMAGGNDYAQELLVKQNVGRAVNSFAHKGPPWYYLMHAPGTFFPWAFLAVVVVVAMFRRRGGEHTQAIRFAFLWILSVLLPFSLISGKLDVYMVPAMVPLALLIGAFIHESRGDGFDRAAHRVNQIMLGLLVAVSAFMAFFGAKLYQPRHSVEAQALESVRQLFLSTAIVSAIALLLVLTSARKSLLRSTVVTALTILFPVLYLNLFLIPVVNEFGSGAPLVRALEKQQVPGREIALYYTPHLWSRGLSERLQSVQMIGEQGLFQLTDPAPRVVVTRASRAKLLGQPLQRYQKVDTFLLKGKEFDVYRRRE